MKLRAGGARIVTTGEGNGPVNALDQALRQAIEQLYPEVVKFELIDYKVRILDQGHGTDAITRVLIETSDGAELVGHRRRRPQRDRGVLGGAARQPHLRAARATAPERSACLRMRRSGAACSSGAGSTDVAERRQPWRRTSKCRWQPSGAPLSEESAIRCPRVHVVAGLHEHASGCAR